MVLVKIEGKWVPGNLNSFGSEPKLQELLESDPFLIPGCADSAVARELYIPNVGFVDLVCVDAQGTISIVECKLKDNPQIRREIVGQIIAYASGLRGTSFGDFDAGFSERTGKSLFASVSAISDPDTIDESAFRNAVEHNLDRGAFRLVVAVDQITPELRKSVEYLNEHLSDLVPFMALEMGYLHHAGVEVLVPQTYGAELESAKRHGQAKPSRRWTTSEVTKAVTEIVDDDQRDFLKKLLHHATEHHAVVKGGTATSPSAGFYYPVAGKRCSIWSLYVKPQGSTIVLNLGAVANTSPELAAVMVEELKSAEVFAHHLTSNGDVAAGKYPAFKVAELTKEAEVINVLICALNRVTGTQLRDHEPATEFLTSGVEV